MKSSSSKTGVVDSFFSHIKIVDFPLALIKEEDRVGLDLFVSNLHVMFDLDNAGDDRAAASNRSGKLEQIDSFLQKLLVSAVTPSVDIPTKKYYYLYCLNQCLKRLEMSLKQGTAPIRFLFSWRERALRAFVVENNSMFTSAQFEALENKVVFKILHRTLSEFQQSLHHPRYLSAYEPRRADIEKYMNRMLSWFDNSKNNIYLLQQTHDELMREFRSLALWRLQADFVYLKQTDKNNADSWLESEGERLNSIFSSNSMLGACINLKEISEEFSQNTDLINSLKEKFDILDKLIEKCDEAQKKSPEEFLKLYVGNRDNTSYKHKIQSVSAQSNEILKSYEKKSVKTSMLAFLGDCAKKNVMFFRRKFEYDLFVAERMIDNKDLLAIDWIKTSNLKGRYEDVLALSGETSNPFAEKIQKIDSFVAKQDKLAADKARAELLREESKEKQSPAQKKADKKEQERLRAEEAVRQREEALKKKKIEEEAKQAKARQQLEEQERAREAKAEQARKEREAAEREARAEAEKQEAQKREQERAKKEAAEKAATEKARQDQIRKQETERARKKAAEGKARQERTQKQHAGKAEPDRVAQTEKKEFSLTDTTTSEKQKLEAEIEVLKAALAAERQKAAAAEKQAVEAEKAMAELSASSETGSVSAQSPSSGLTALAQDSPSEIAIFNSSISPLSVVPTPYGWVEGRWLQSPYFSPAHSGVYDIVVPTQQGPVHVGITSVEMIEKVLIFSDTAHLLPGVSSAVLPSPAGILPAPVLFSQPSTGVNSSASGRNHRNQTNGRND